MYKQLTIDGFRSSLDGLDKSNRWVWLGDHLPWEEFEKQYGQTLKNQTAGAGEKPARMVIGAMLVKHLTRLSDVDTIEMIRENPYIIIDDFGMVRLEGQIQHDFEQIIDDRYNRKALILASPAVLLTGTTYSRAS